METFGKGLRDGRGSSATVALVGRYALRLGALCLLVLGGAASSLLAAGPRAGTSTTGSTLALSLTTTSATTTAAATTAATTTTSTASSVLAFSGHGWGHGLGLSQWGAYGYAKHGWTYDRILAHYYSGTTLGSAKVATVRVLLAQARAVTLASTTAWTVSDAQGTVVQLDPGTVKLTSKLTLPGQTLQPPLTFAGKQPIALGGTAYRGKLVVSGAGKLVQVVDVVGLEPYLKGVVPAEMPSTWGPEALKAQAVAARSYALANLAKGRDFDLYGDTRDQAYGGVESESPAASAAVDATKGQVVLYNGKVADTLFFSTSGGRTASALESTGTAVPYLVSVSDPYDTASPYHDWGPVLYDAAKVARQLKLAGPLDDLQTTAGASGRVQKVTAVSSNDTEATFTGSQIRTALDLRSTWFTPALLSLAPAAKAMTYGGAVSLSGFERGAAPLSLESKQGAADWLPAGDLTVGADGAWSLIVRPQVSTRYRVAWGSVRAGLARIAVAPRVSGSITAAGASGTIRPSLADANVQLQRQTSGKWTTIASGVTAAGGAWSFAQPLGAGTYRVRCAPGHNLAVGLSTTFQAP
jgi:stage II sporulation protein D